MDARVLDFIDDLNESVRSKLCYASEHEGGIVLMWHDKIPEGFGGHFNDGVSVRDGDWWTILESTVAGKETV